MYKNVVLIVVVLTCVLFYAEAGRGGRRGGKNRNEAGCGEWQLQECTPKTGSCGRGTQQGTRTAMDSSCTTTSKTFKCRVPCSGDDAPGEVRGNRRRPGNANKKETCRYSKRGAVKGACDPNTNTRKVTLTLKNGPDSCAQTKEITRPCREERGRRTAGRGRQNACRYQRGEWSECNESTNTMSRTLTLKKGDRNACEATKTVTKRCKKEKCTFGPWSDFGPCQNGVKTKTRQVTSGGEGCQSKTSKTKPCRN